MISAFWETGDMQLALVVGTATSTIKHATMRGQKLLVVQPLLADGRDPDGDPQIAVDAVGAGRGERVMISSDGKYVREVLKAEATPVRWSVIGIGDQ
jgi:bacterial microcompartment shell vertex protein